MDFLSFLFSDDYPSDNPNDLQPSKLRQALSGILSDDDGDSDDGDSDDGDSDDGDSDDGDGDND